MIELGHAQVWWADLDKVRPVVVLTRAGGGSADGDHPTAAGAAFCRLPCAPSDLVTMVARQLAGRRRLNP